MTGTTDLRDAREKAFWALWRRWRDEPQRFAAELLDAFGRLDDEHVPDMVAPAVKISYPVSQDEAAAYAEQHGAPAGLAEDELIEWLKANPPLIERVLAALPPAEVPAETAPPALRSKPQPRRRTAPKGGGL